MAKNNKNNKNILVFDTETTGLPIRGADIKDCKKWDVCRLVQIAWACYTEQGDLISTECYTVRPEGFTIPDEVAKIHGITTKHAELTGEPVKEVLDKFLAVLSRAKRVVAHNIEFDYNLICAELYRATGSIPVFPEKYCTMKANMEPGQKWLRLADLYQKVCGKPVVGWHQADNDVRFCAEIYFKTKVDI